ncbi:RBP11-like subunits of RNA polymerase [Lactarius indigo]|nr:RBP11-like subunits of RNA polymerase [Lactarius indigo]
MTEVPPKIRIMPGAKSDLSAATYQIHNETHTLGNALRWMLMKNPKVEFCGYRHSLLYSHDLLYFLNLGANADSSAPHPSENHIQVRIQMYDNLSSLAALLGALDDLDALFESIEDAYNASLQHDDFEIWDEKR